MLTDTRIHKDLHINSYGHYLRRRFTINKLRLLFGWE